MTHVIVPETNDAKDTPEAYSDNPYAAGIEESQQLLGNLIKSEQPYIDKTTNPDIGDMAIYLLDGDNPLSDVARSLEGRIFADEWKLPTKITQQDFAPFEDNSSFFVLLDVSDVQKPEVAAALRVADYNRGPTETISFYHEYFGEDKEVPAALLPNEPGAELWDIVGIAADPNYRNGESSAWLYHALYKRSLELGVQKWTSNVTDKEIRNLRKLVGIPFAEIAEIEPAEYVSPVDNSKKTIFRFYNIDVSTILPSVSSMIAQREQAHGQMNQRLARVARIALLGNTNVAA